jgi:hypothetical protein
MTKSRKMWTPTDPNKMNKRIKELLKQATKEVDPYDRVWVFSKVDQARFAELIVKETMQVVANQLPSNQYLNVAEAVITHFGVEE